MRQRLFRVLVWLPLACAAAAEAQTTGTIEGRISDLSGGALPGVTVEATSPSLQGTRVGVTERDGSYRFLALPPGGYKVRASLDGFRPDEKTATVSLDATTTVDMSVTPIVHEQVIVSGEAPLVDVTSTTTGTNYTSGVISQLPVGRNYADIVRSNPGVSTDRGETQGRSLALAIYGATSAENQWIIDGVNTTNVIKGSQGKAINSEFVQEVEVKTGGYQAEYGRALGGVINVITKSGGNQFHGDGFVYYDARNLTASPVVTPQDSVIAEMRTDDYKRTDFGLDLGGSLVKDRLWFFGAYNRVNLTAKVSRYVSTPYVSASDQFPLDGTDNLYSGKLTWNLGTGTTIVGTIFSDPTSNKGAAGSDPRQGIAGINVPPVTNRDPTTWNSTRQIGAIDFGARLNQIFGSRALLTLQGSRHQDQYRLVAPNLVRTDDFTCSGGTADQPCDPPPVPNVSTGGYGVVGGATNHNRSSRDQYRGDLSLYLGDHEIKLGGDYQKANTDALSYFSGGSQVRIYNKTGVTYYQHSFFAASRSI
jgi:Carboxypeptidase regulatory-like domain/TonB-dependent Receptor Plug Domain